MRYRECVSAAVATVMLGACAVSPPLVWRHQSGSNDRDQFTLDRTVCEGRVASARIPGPSGPPAGGGIAAGMAAGSRDARNSSDRGAVFRGCMAERGWVQTRQ